MDKETANKAIDFCNSCDLRGTLITPTQYCAAVGLANMLGMTRALAGTEADEVYSFGTQGATVSSAGEVATDMQDNYFLPEIVACADSVRAGNGPIIEENA